MSHHYKPLITLKKGVYQAVIVGASAFVVSLLDYFQTLPPDQNFYVFPLMVVVLNMVKNWLKHRKG